MTAPTPSIPLVRRIVSGRRRASLGTGRLWFGAIAIVAIRIVYDAVRTLLAWDDLDRSWLVGVAWIVLIVANLAVIAATRALGEHLPTWLFALFGLAVVIAIALDVVSVWGEPDLASRLTVAIAAATSLILVSTTRADWELVLVAGLATLGVATASTVSIAAPIPSSADLFVFAQMIVPSVVFVSIIDSFRSFVQVELDRSLVQGTVAAPRLAVGMLASEQLARLDLAAEELLGGVADGRIPLPMAPAEASRAGSLATELRMHLLEGRKQTWLFHAITESDRLGRSVSVVDTDSVAGLLDTGQRDGLLSVIWLLLDPRADRASQRRITVRIGPMQSLPEVTRLAVVPIVLTTTGVNRTRVDPAIWAELQRIGQHWDSVDGGSLRLDIRCMTTGPGAVA